MPLQLRPMEPEFCYGNGSCVRTVYPVTVHAILYLTLGSAVVLTVLGNLFVIVAIAHFKQLHTPTNYLTLSLAVSDLLLGVLVMFPSMIQSIETCWYFGDILCKLFNSSDILLCTASILNLSFISMDRYYAVCQPLLYPHKITVHTAVIMILVTWCVSAVVGFGMIFLKLNILGMEEFYYNNVACEGGCIMLTTGVWHTVCHNRLLHPRGHHAGHLPEDLHSGPETRAHHRPTENPVLQGGQAPEKSHQNAGHHHGRVSVILGAVFPVSLSTPTSATPFRPPCSTHSCGWGI
ncbi:unnamed protein product [Arctogadus glacialis]